MKCKSARIQLNLRRAWKVDDVLKERGEIQIEIFKWNIIVSYSKNYLFIWNNANANWVEYYPRWKYFYRYEKSKWFSIQCRIPTEFQNKSN